MSRLSNATLTRLPASVTRPRYDRNQLAFGILHFGIGNFHRAHQAVYTDDVLNDGDPRWGIIGVSLRHPNVRDALLPQDGLYFAGIKGASRTDWRVIGSVRDTIFAPENPRSVFNAIASPATKIISFTITEKAYCLDTGSGALDETHPEIIHDLANPENPITVLGYLAAGLAKRHAQKIPLPTLLSCDNLAANGRQLRSALIGFTAQQRPELAKVLADQLLCPSTMVDRIVPQTTDQDRDAASHASGFYDAWPVMTESFTQWVIEDRFALERPGWNRFGAEFVSDVSLYERMKLGLLNASHTALAILGLLSGHDTVATAMNDKTLDHFIDHFMRDDIAPALGLPADMNVTTYIDSLLLRFRNPALHHNLLQIVSDSSQKIQHRFMPTIFMRLNRGLPLGRFAFAIAGFILLLENVAAQGGSLAFTDPGRESLIASLIQAGSNDADRLRALLGHHTIFGELRNHEDSVRELSKALSAMRQYGVQKALNNEYQ